MEWTEAIGWLASGLVLLSFLMTVMTRLRVLAAVSNVVFITYAVMAGLTPVLVLHIILLPVNLWRLWQIRQLIAMLEQTETGGFATDWLVKHATPEFFAAGSDIVRSGSPASELYLINSGEAEVVGVDVVLGQGDIVGEIGMFTDSRSHGADVRSLTDVEALRISRQTMMELYHRDPAIALQMTRLIVGRLTSA